MAGQAERVKALEAALQRQTQETQGVREQLAAKTRALDASARSVIGSSNLNLFQSSLG